MKNARSVCVVVGVLTLSCGSDASSTSDNGDSGSRGGATVSDAGYRDGGSADSATRDASAPGDADDSGASIDAASSDACASSAGAEPSDSTGCNAAPLYARPADPGARGPWAVGAHTATIAGLRTEIWYPARWGSEACRAKVTYDIREHLPKADQTKIPDADNPLQACDCYRDLPIDEKHGPYPVISFIHGTAAFRTQSLTFATHWASRGFVVIASDHPHIELGDVLALLQNPGLPDQAGDALKVLAALDSPAGDVAFLTGHLDMQRVGAAGHSAGGQAVSGLPQRRAGVRVVVPMAAGGVTAGGDLASSLIMSAADDGIAQPSGQKNGYASSPSPKRFVQIADAGHLVFSDLCSIGASEGGLLAIAMKYGVGGASTLASLANDGCPWQTGKSYTAIQPADGWAIVNYATSAVFESTLMCDGTMAARISAIASNVPHVADFEESP